MKEESRQVSLRLNVYLIKRVEKLVKVLRISPDYRGVGVSKASVYRMALYKGLEVLEREARERRSR